MEKQFKRYLLTLAWISLLFFWHVSAFASGLSVDIIDVGQGLSVLLECDGHFALYDGGGPDYSSTVVSFLRKRRVENLDYVIASHYDEDHINGLIGAMNAFEVDTVLSPDYEADTYIYRSFSKTMERKRLIPVHPAAGETFSLGKAVLTVLSPLKTFYIEENSYSLVIHAAYIDSSILITGDATVENEEEMVQRWKKTGLLSSGLLVLGHHGSSSSTSELLLRYAGKEGAVVSCGRNNSYGHPSFRVMELLRKRKIPVYRTDRQGDLHFHTDGSSWESDKPPCSDYSTNQVMEEDLLSTFLEGLQALWDHLLPQVEQEPPEPSQWQNNQTGGAQTGQTSSPSEASSGIQDIASPSEASSDTQDITSPSSGDEKRMHYVVNQVTFKFHYPHCQSLSRMNQRNREDVFATRSELIYLGYIPCQVCLP